jgi:hypothetical protein
MAKIQSPKKLKDTQQPTEPYKRDYLPMWCKGIMGGCVNCGGCI